MMHGDDHWRIETADAMSRLDLLRCGPTRRCLKSDGGIHERHRRTPVDSTMQRHPTVYFNFASSLFTLHDQASRHLPDSLSVDRSPNPDFHLNLPLQIKSFESSSHTTFTYIITNTNTQKPLSTIGIQLKTLSLEPSTFILQRQWRLPKSSTSSRATRTSSPKCRPSCPRRPSTCARKPWIWSRSRVLSRRFRGTRRSGLRRRYVCSLSLSLSPFFIQWSLLFFLFKASSALFLGHFFPCRRSFPFSRLQMGTIVGEWE
jgi:hypothetical protein